MQKFSCYKQILIIFTCLLSGSSFANDSVFLPIANTAARLEQAKQALSSRAEYCFDLERQNVVSLNDEWLLQQTGNVQQTVLLVLSIKAMDRCMFDARNAFTLAVFDLAVETGEMEKLAAWNELRRIESFDVPTNLAKKETLDLLNSMNQKELLRLSEQPEFSAPFHIKHFP